MDRVMVDFLYSYTSPLTSPGTHADFLPEWLASVPKTWLEGSASGLCQMQLVPTWTSDSEDDGNEGYRHQQKQ